MHGRKEGQNELGGTCIAQSDRMGYAFMVSHGQGGQLAGLAKARRCLVGRQECVITTPSSAIGRQVRATRSTPKLIPRAAGLAVVVFGRGRLVAVVAVPRVRA